MSSFRMDKLLFYGVGGWRTLPYMKKRMLAINWLLRKFSNE